MWQEREMDVAPYVHMQMSLGRLQTMNISALRSPISSEIYKHGLRALSAVHNQLVLFFFDSCGFSNQDYHDSIYIHGFNYMNPTFNMIIL